jgi:hypothetical protein
VATWGPMRVGGVGASVGVWDLGVGAVVRDKDFDWVLTRERNVVGLGALASAQRVGLDARAIGGDGTARPIGSREVGESGRIWTKATDGRIALLTHRPAQPLTRWCDGTSCSRAVYRRETGMTIWADCVALPCLHKRRRPMRPSVAQEKD